MKKKRFLWTMVAAQAAENDKDEWGLTWYLQWGIYTSVPTWTHSQNSLAPAEDLAAAEDLEDADLDIKYFFSETLPDYFQNTNNKDYSILHLNIRSLQKHFNDFVFFCI